MRCNCPPSYERGKKDTDSLVATVVQDSCIFSCNRL
jgi:hypothetical protein